MVENKDNMLKREGIAEELIQQIVVADVNTYVKTFYNQKMIFLYLFMIDY